ncbi:MvdC/MvdD family ATP grasp protein [Dactylosporangium sp. NPDC005555]|uniref:MvdC/MvdD family ATP grasp protein n=1 Tax=Dactylosporangium sp. NPDC005555 TaxID=3154889 RepID=UPI0033AE68B3
MTSRILVLTADGDITAERVAGLLTERGAEVLLFDPGTVPSGAQVELTAGGTGPVRRWLRRSATGGEQDVDLDGLTCVWHRRPSAPVPPHTVTDPDTRAHLAAEVRTYLDGMWRGLRCRQVPATRDVIDRADRKSFHLAVAAGLGFALPPTLITADPDRFLDFYDAHDGKIITKPLHRSPRGTEDAPLGRFTEPVGNRDLAHVGALRLAPMIVQAYVPKRVEVRVTVVGGAVFAAEIHSQATAHTRYDWRRYDHANTPLKVHPLPRDVTERCRALVAALGLSFGAVDLILTPEGRYVFLEINPNGQFDWLELATGLPITDAVARLLQTGPVTDSVTGSVTGGVPA